MDSPEGLVAESEEGREEGAGAEEEVEVSPEEDPGTGEEDRAGALAARAAVDGAEAESPRTGEGTSSREEEEELEDGGREQSIFSVREERTGIREMFLAFTLRSERFSNDVMWRSRF
jgi:hypothetical protein